MQNSSNKTFTYLALGVIGAVILFLVYRFWLKPPAATDSLIGLTPAGTAAATEGTDAFVFLLTSLQAINLSGANNVLPVLAKFTDFSTELRPQTPGRPNPFAPVGLDRSVPFSSGAASTTPLD